MRAVERLLRLTILGSGLLASLHVADQAQNRVDGGGSGILGSSGGGASLGLRSVISTPLGK
jgi:hypothetical protein